MKFSVLLPTRNRLDLLSRAIETVLMQDYDNWEIIVSDNYSEENISDYILSLNEPRIKYYRTNNFIPVTDNWNNALKHSNGDYIIMLGDDDGLTKNYFSRMSDLIEQYLNPEVLYTNAFLYAYPNVLPEIPLGFLKLYSNRKLFIKKNKPYFLEKDLAYQFVNDSLNFTATFDYNMQFSLVSRKLIDKMNKYGSFYQSPYPDYYASNAMFLEADKILVVPTPEVIIGISPKSFGYYYFNDEEESGGKFLNNILEEDLRHKLERIILPGSEMNTSWLASMQMLVDNFGSNYKIRVNYKKYRKIQIFNFLINFIKDDKNRKFYENFINKVTLCEKVKYIFPISIIKTILPNKYLPYLKSRLISILNTHPALPMPEVQKKYNNILEVFNDSKI